MIQTLSFRRRMAVSQAAVLVLCCLTTVAMVIQAAAQAGDPQAEWRANLNEILGELTVTEERQNELRGEIAALDQDRAALNEELIRTNQNIQNYERDIDAIEDNLAVIGTVFIR